MFVLADRQRVIRAKVDVLDQEHDGFHTDDLDQFGPVVPPIAVLCQTRTAWKPQRESDLLHFCCDKQLIIRAIFLRVSWAKTGTGKSYHEGSWWAVADCRCPRWSWSEPHPEFLHPPPHHLFPPGATGTAAEQRLKQKINSFTELVLHPYFSVTGRYLVWSPQVLHPDFKALSLLWQFWVNEGPQHLLLWFPQTLEWNINCIVFKFHQNEVSMKRAVNKQTSVSMSQTSRKGGRVILQDPCRERCCSVSFWGNASSF